MHTSRVRWLFGSVVLFVLLLPACSNTPATTASPASAQPVPGYIDTSPAFFIQPESGLSVDIFNATYDPETGGLKSYDARVRFPSGASSALEFRDIVFNPSTGHVDAYEASIDGNELQGPTIDAFENQGSELGPVLAFSISSFAGAEPLPLVSVPCQGESNVEYEQSEGRQQVVRHVITCSDQTYTLQYSAYTYDNQLGTLAGYSVLVEVGL